MAKPLSPQNPSKKPLNDKKSEKYPFLREFNLTESDRAKLRNLMDCLNGKSPNGGKRTYLILGKNASGKTRLAQKMITISFKMDKVESIEVNALPNESSLQTFLEELKEGAGPSKDSKPFVVIDGIPEKLSSGTADESDTAKLNRIIEAVHSNKNAYLLATTNRELKLSGTNCRFDETIVLNCPPLKQQEVLRAVHVTAPFQPQLLAPGRKTPRGGENKRK